MSMVEFTKVDPLDFPLEEGESWWVVHPNRSMCEFKVPDNAITVCTETFLGYMKGIVYSIIKNDSDNGWITLKSDSQVTEMPYYVFARYFDAEAFVRGVIANPCELENAKPWNCLIN